jgi:transposase-like protein
MNETEFKKLALIGARARLIEIDEERDRLVAMFPELAERKRKPYGPRAKASTEPAVIFDAGESKPSKRASTIANKATRKKVRTPGGRSGKPRRVHSAEMKAEAVARVKAGDPVSDISRAFDVGDSMIRRWAELAGVTPKPMSMEERVARTLAAKRKAKPTRNPIRAAKREELLVRVAEGAEINATARELGINQATARGWVARSSNNKRG